MTIKANDIIELEITALGSDGIGYGKHENTVFVPFTLYGEFIRARIDRIKKNGTAYGTVMKIIKPSKERVKAPCSVFGRCGGCSLQHMSYREQLKYKAENVKNIFKKIGGIEIETPEITASANQYGYRNKLQLPVGAGGIGFYESGTHKIVPISGCPLNGDFASKIIDIVKLYAKKTGILVYSETEHRGLLRHVVARKLGGCVTVTLVINGRGLPDAALLGDLVKEAFDDYSLFLNINSQKTNVILGEETIFIGGKKTLSCNISGMDFRVSQNSFMQVNDEMRDKLYAAAVEAVKASKPDLVIEAYSGISIIGSLIAMSGIPVYAFESVQEAVIDANYTAKKYNLPLQSIQGDIIKTLPEFINFLSKNKHSAEEDLITSKKMLSSFGISKQRAWEGSAKASFPAGHYDTLTKKENLNIAVIADPSRKGCSPEFLNCILSLAPRHFVYISCDPATLARDLKILSSKYALVESPSLFDMFPQTSHVETLVRLTRRD